MASSRAIIMQQAVKSLLDKQVEDAVKRQLANERNDTPEVPQATPPVVESPVLVGNNKTDSYTPLSVFEDACDRFSEKFADSSYEHALTDRKVSVVTEELKSIGELTRKHQAAIKQLEEKLKPRTVVIHEKENIRVDVGYVHEKYEAVLRRAACGVNVLLVGPTQCGKTTLAEQVAIGLDRPFGAISMSAGTKESDLNGWLLPMGKDGAFEYQASPLVQNVLAGGLFLFDEIDASDANLMLMLNMLIANRKMFIPHRLGDQLLLAHEEWGMMGAANTNGTGADARYVGRNQLDAATLARFVKVEIDYDPVLEHCLYHPEAVKLGHVIRANIRKHKLRRDLTSATLSQWSKMLNSDQGFTMADCVGDYLIGWTTEEKQIAMSKNAEAVEQTATAGVAATVIKKSSYVPPMPQKIAKAPASAHKALDVTEEARLLAADLMEGL